MQHNKRKLCKRKFLPGSTVFYLSKLYTSQSIFDRTAFYRKLSRTAYTCCAVQVTCLVWTQEGKRHKASLPRLAGARGVLATEWDATVLAPLRNPGPSLPSKMTWRKGWRSRKKGTGQGVLLNRGTAAKAPLLMEHNARELFYGGPRPCGELAIALATGNWLARKAANWLTHQSWSIN